MKNTDENTDENKDKTDDTNIKLIMKIIHMTKQLQEMNTFFIDDLDNSTISQEIQNKIDVFKLFMNKNVELYEVIKIDFQDILMKICDHDWIVDYVDSSTYECKRIEYCDKCKSTKILN